MSDQKYIDLLLKYIVDKYDYEWMFDEDSSQVPSTFSTCSVRAKQI